MSRAPPTAPTAELRQADRRSVRRSGRPDESWFGKPLAEPAPMPPADVIDEAATEPPRDDAGLGTPGAAAPTGRAAPADGRAQAAFERIFRVFLAARVALAGALIVAVVAGGLFGIRPTGLVVAVSVAYAVLATALWTWPRLWRAREAPVRMYLGGRPWAATIGVDLVAFMGLHVLASGSSLNYAALLVLPVLMAGVLSPRITALAAAAATALGLLGAAWMAVAGGAEGTTQITQAGLAGTGLFVIAVLASELASRLAREELAARGNREMARRQAQLNRLVIEEMQDGVLVVDRGGRVRAANPAARRLLAPSGLWEPAPFQLRGVPAWQTLVEAVERAFGEAAWPEGGRDVVLAFPAAPPVPVTAPTSTPTTTPTPTPTPLRSNAPVSAIASVARTRGDAPSSPRPLASAALPVPPPWLASAPVPVPPASAAGSAALTAAASHRTLRMRVRFTTGRESEAAEEFCVLFLEDVRNMQARTRQEKLAAMGRVSAGIAHEIRNPLAAIAQANGLLAEDLAEPAQQRLTRMVGANVERLKRIVDDVMEVASNAAADVVPIDATAHIETACGEWAQAHAVSVGAHGVLRPMLPAEALSVCFDAEHLRRVLVNLLDNALQHSSGAPGAIEVRLDSRHEAQAFLAIASDGPPIPADVEPHLFEPFFSTRSRGSGLGLYICRELCERYGARIDYRLRGTGAGQRNEFFVEMQRRA